MRAIGLTGGIGSGKSTVSGYLKEKGYYVVDADSIAHELTEPGSPVLGRLAEAFGSQILFSDGSLDRKGLAAMVFPDEKKKEMLDQITHGEICHRIQQELDAFTGDIIFLDIPLLFEAGMEQLTDEVWVVDSEDDVRIRRVKERDGLSEREIRSRMDRQLPREEKLRRADHVLFNSGTQQELFKQIEQLIGEMQ